jgi:hypothetical protein
MIIEQPVFNQLVFDAFTRQISWLEASRRFPTQDYIDTFLSLRAAMRRLLEGATDAQVGHTDANTPAWSLSEAVTHIIYSQNFYHNQLLDITTTDLPHLVEAAQGFGEGAKINISAENLRNDLDRATELILFALAQTKNFDPQRTTIHAFFGEVNYASWVLLLAGHELDHYRQSVVMRRLARAAHPSPAMATTTTTIASVSAAPPTPAATVAPAPAPTEAKPTEIAPVAPTAPPAPTEAKPTEVTPAAPAATVAPAPAPTEAKPTEVVLAAPPAPAEQNPPKIAPLAPENKPSV